ncbi:MAG TPA: FmdB family zinc ribbon protein [Cytophagaceae bacterium]|jgi:putative FmdB family regulatory protein|nr:FmdB family zinc ribbon protein [Cytophagaceae bacterium]
MPTYTYFCEIHKEFDAFHSITMQLEECPACKEAKIKSDPPKRLIAKGGTFILSGSGWAKDNYK